MRSRDAREEAPGEAGCRARGRLTNSVGYAYRNRGSFLQVHSKRGPCGKFILKIMACSGNSTTRTDPAAAQEAARARARRARARQAGGRARLAEERLPVAGAALGHHAQRAEPDLPVAARTVASGRALAPVPSDPRRGQRTVGPARFLSRGRPARGVQRLRRTAGRRNTQAPGQRHHVAPGTPLFALVSGRSRTGTAAWRQDRGPVRNGSFYSSTLEHLSFGGESV